MRVLKQQMAILGREIGNIFIPLLMKIIPVAIAVAKVLVKVARTIAKLFGFELPELNWDSVTSGSGQLADDMEDAVDSAKEFKKQLQGFDELNVITSPSEGGGSGSISSGGFELDLPEYDMLKGFDKQLDDLEQQIMDFFGLVENDEGGVDWLGFGSMSDKAKLLTAGIGLLVGKKALGGLKAIFGSTAAAGAKTTGIFTKLGTGLKTVATGIGGYFSNTFSVIKALFKGTVTFSDAANTIFPPVARTIAGVLLSIKGVSDTQDVWKNQLEDTTKVIGDLSQAQINAGAAALEMVAGGALIGSAFGPVGSVVGAAAGGIAAVVTNLTDLDNKLQEVVERNTYGDLELSVEDLAGINDYFATSLTASNKAYDEFKASLSGSQEVFETSYSNMDTLLQKYGLLGESLSGITGETLTESMQQVSTNAIKLVEQTSDGVIAQYQIMWKEGTKLTEEEQKGILQTIESAKQGRINQIKEIEQNITNIIKEAKAKNRDLTQEEIEQIKEEQSKLIALTETNLTNTGNTLYAITQRMENSITSLTKESWTNLNDQYTEKSKELRDAIQKDYDDRLEIATTYGQAAYEEALRNGKDTNEASKAFADAYNKIAEDAEKVRLEKLQEADAKEAEFKKIAYSNLSKAYLDYATKARDQRKAQAEIALLEEKENNAKTEDERKKAHEELLKAQENYNKKFGDATIEYNEKQRDELKGLLDDAKIQNLEIVEMAKDVGKNSAEGLSDEFNNNVKLNAPELPEINSHIKMPHFSWSTVEDNGWVGDILSTLGLPRSIPKLSIEWYANGGFPTTGQMFMAREAGPELVGSIGNRTAVANNDQIVEGISAGVYNAMVSANTENSNYIVVNVGNKKLYSGMVKGISNENNRYGRTVVEV